ncbi:MAG: hypothetical protein WCK39_07405 [Methanomassiliicoccales archaeon]
MKGTGHFEVITRLFFRDNPEIPRRLEELGKTNPNSKLVLSIFNGRKLDRTNKIVAVGANWTESRHVFGYYNPLISKYVTTPALEVLVSAGQPGNSAIPHFVIFDEMNLSHVERYFSDFLSAMEIEGGTVDLHSSDDEKCTVPKQIPIGNNVIVIGTVNVDETTYMFSPKVLDRANVIEMKPVSPRDYLQSMGNPDLFSGSISYLAEPLDDSGFRQIGVQGVKGELKSVVTQSGKPIWDELTDVLEEIQQDLDGSSFELGIRSLNEVVGFLFVSWVYEGRPVEFLRWQRYLDAAILQRILPKIHGSNKETLDLLTGLFEICIDAQGIGTGVSLSSEQNEIEGASRFPKSAMKLSEMYQILKHSKYVSFIR